MPKRLHVVDSEPPTFRNTESGNAERFLHQYHGDVRYVDLWGKWLIWDGKRWTIDTGSGIEQLGQKTQMSIYEEAAKTEDRDARRELAAWARKSDCYAQLQNMLRFARFAPGTAITDPDVLDSDGWLLNCANGTLNLRANTFFRPHDRMDLITKLVDVAYDPAATCPTWNAFLERILPSEALRVYVQRAVGYSLTAETSEQVLFLCYGLGANGKSTFLETLQMLLGDYGNVTDFTTFIQRDRDTVRNDLAALRGARLVTASESGADRRLDEVVVKQMTGSDRVTARFLHQEFFTYRPIFKLWLAANHRPIIRGTDHAIWRRVRLIPFEVTIPPDEQDRELPTKLRTELPGILNWMLEGCRAWQREGLGSAPEVLAATEEYRREMDELGDFIAQCCVSGEHYEATSAELYQGYVAYCSREGQKPISNRWFGRQLRERGYQPTRSKSAKKWAGIALDGTSLDLQDGDVMTLGDLNIGVSRAREHKNGKTPEVTSPNVTDVTSEYERVTLNDPERLPENVCLTHNQPLRADGSCPECGF